MIPKLILQTYPLPLESVKIGSLITDPLHPNEDTQNGSTPLSLETDCSVSRTGPRLEVNNDSSNTSIVVKLLSSLYGYLQNSATSSQKIVADNTCTYELNNPNNRFKDLTSQEGVQTWIQAQVEEENTIHLITGIQTTLNQLVEASGNSKLSSSGSVSPDPYTGLIVKAMNASDSKLNASHSQRNDTGRFLSTEGERVVAVRIRRVLVKEANGATLDQKNRSIWKMVGDNRGEALVEQLVEAILQEEDDDCGGTTEVLNTGDGDKKLVYVALKGSDNNLD
ncbi:hypothetical protein MMC31_002111 [Peltigera leucophlebia]|nr:hypothetical protein [Peltigera leucophlebia]